MKLRDLVAGIATVQPTTAANTDIGAIVEDSRLVTPGCLYVARPGTKTDGRAFVAEAIERG
ncbi:MAG: UDP-N-acetylmuramoyl-L-alanyl-D-glutamate--2,6-diaminopimelate ligase, partial [Phycisphaerae bacterium]|nr:UDP-N-acetylmuramoyl-L-alanyl-D-glutamate--2,6-diaminopimelate ligase [Phycisphaerae bacterium]